MRLERRRNERSAAPKGVIGEPSVLSPFGVKTSRSFAVLDKSFLDGINSAQLQYYAQQGWTFGLPEVLMYEHFRKRDQRRIANLFKLHSIEASIVLLPGIGEMFRSEAKTLKPARTTMRAKRIEFTIQKGPSGEYFELDGPSLMSTEERSRELKVSNWVTKYISPDDPAITQNGFGGTNPWGGWDQQHQCGHARCAGCWRAGSVVG